MSPDNKARFLAEKEAIHLILTGIGDDIYSTVDACQITQEMFVTIVKQQHKLDEVSYHKLFDILKQYQNEVNELRAEKLVKNANPLTLVATAQADQDQYYQISRSHRSSAPSPKPSIPSRSHTTTRHKGKEIAKPITPLSETASEEDNNPKQAQRDKDMQKNLALIAKIVNVVAAKENVGSKVVQQSGIQCFNCKEYGHFAKECRKPKRVKDSAYHKEKMLLYEVVDEQELEAHYSYMAKIHEVPTVDSGTDSKPVEQTKQAEFEKYKAFNDRTIDYDKLKHQFRALTAQDMEILIQTCLMPLSIKTQNDSSKFVHELKQEMHADLKYVESLEKEIDELESDKAEFSDTELKKLIEKGKGKSADTKFDRPSVVRQPNAQQIPKLSVLGKPTPFSDSLERKYFQKTKSVLKANVSEGLSKPVIEQTLPQTTKKVILQLILFIVDSGCMKHVTVNLKLLCNFVEKFLCTVRFGNDQFVPILGYGDLVQGNEVNMFRDLQGNDLLIGNRGSDLYTICLQESTSSTPICLMSKATPTQAWLWHRRLTYLNFDYINLLSKKDIVIGLPKLKYVKDQLCSSCELSKAKRISFKLKAVPSSKGRLNLLHMDLYGPMRVASINGKKYILVIVDDYSRYTWTLFLRSKDETPEVLKDFLMMIQRNLQASVITVQTNRGTEFLNKTLNAFSKEERIKHQTSTARTPEQNGVVKRRNRTLVKENTKKDKIGLKPDKNGKRGEAGKSQKQLQWIEQEKLKKTKKEGPKMQTHASF
uniref:Retrovirus-related Pol polyprotein from transposon TNT 1-94 n=1 Tax=Tanacetum cinerariifolium TaxID=118510 RepID=A0A6L2KHW4_TANCI|nr:hypothetical protein [Tanacetum cinerariifolium]